MDKMSLLMSDVLAKTSDSHSISVFYGVPNDQKCSGDIASKKDAYMNAFERIWGASRQG